jgi:hypothetical protein
LLINRIILQSSYGFGEWQINFSSGAEVLSNSSKDLEKIYNLLIQAENSKLTIVGHT